MVNFNAPRYFFSAVDLTRWLFTFSSISYPLDCQRASNCVNERISINHTIPPNIFFFGLFLIEKLEFFVEIGRIVQTLKFNKNLTRIEIEISHSTETKSRRTRAKQTSDTLLFLKKNLPKPSSPDILIEKSC